jgi:Xaa-Pro dipeptidase
MAPHSLPVVPKPAVAAEAEIAKKAQLPTKQHCLRVKKLMQPELLHNRSSVIYMKGNVEETRDNTDVDLEFRQESYFFYMTGNKIKSIHLPE